ncbi:peptidase M24, structural domain-containing protein [Kockovaella imperatae]|uniref:Methionine aminopeptidase n=1 Tax=Kockovaella imperatae TaxID=4999 RepID=A0A1Y1UGC9_9TREE|nr:peptidase M24, structural domain-containing protein [Kockovaella imperatae]ORX36564.1 peptidase M24, structural domain-containing protein [Kockovaella imperatae]
MRPSLRLLSTTTKSRFGTYTLLSPDSALTSYPSPRHVPGNIKRPDYVPRNFFTAPWGHHDPPKESPEDEVEGRRIRKGSEEESRVREAGKLAGQVLAQVKALIVVGGVLEMYCTMTDGPQPGRTTDEIDQAVHGMIVAAGAYPSTLGYTSYPRSCTVAVNNVLARECPDLVRPLESHDLINVDLTVFLNGHHGDTSATFALRRVDDQGLELIESTKEALEQAIRVCGPGVPLNEIGRVVEELAEKRGLCVNRQFAGHGIGRRFHQPPYILHHRNDDDTLMRIGDCFTIEPILVQGPNSRGFIWDDGFTMSSESGARSAQFEHQILITDDGCDVLTRSITD